MNGPPNWPSPFLRAHTPLTSKNRVETPILRVWTRNLGGLRVRERNLKGHGVPYHWG